MNWLYLRHPPADVQQIQRLMAQKPRKQTGSYTGNAKLWNWAGYELGICDEAMKQYHQFTAANNLVMPPRELPAVTRNRNEPIQDYLSRMHQSLLEGRKTADIRWTELRHLATSQYDLLRETYDRWHTDLTFYNEVLRDRATTTVGASHLRSLERQPDGKLGVEIQLRSDAYRSTMYLMHLGHAFWRTAATLFDELIAQNLVSSSAIERAYTNDPRLKWRLVSMIVMARLFQQKYADKISTIISYQPAFRPFIKRFRTEDGLLHLEMNLDYIATHRFKGDTVDELMVAMCTRPAGGFYTILDDLNKILRKNDSEKNKFDQNCWDELGNLSNTYELTTEFVQSDFGQRLMARSNHTLTVAEEKILKEEICFMNPNKIQRENASPTGLVAQDFGHGRQLVYDMINTWFLEVYDDVLTPYEFLQASALHDLYGNTREPFAGKSEREKHAMMIQPFDEMWNLADKELWKKAKKLDPPGRPGLVAKTFGLVDPYSSDRRSYMEIFQAELKAEQERLKNPVVAPQTQAVKAEYQTPFPVANPADKAGQSGHSVVAGKDVKQKVKTRAEEGSHVPVESSAPVNEEDYEGTDEYMPMKYRLPRKVWKIFDRLLEDENPSLSTSQKKGQIRWAEFEHAMKRVGFEVIQTMGSSVRFVPPASSERAISFHRPHPDSIMTPPMIKIVGARLRRRYGWTPSSFERKEAEGEENNDAPATSTTKDNFDLD
ncbi:hypothetical protein CYLTODRAFT_445853 [Cylindrobasidium torrendii FP15055 ss-10]|uniref:Uncharacterized protein n=1 Tax=Cylindrobasidium torrendii FP15055 ss-10 TaxID=1314674 RepID=A0A0D7B1Z1_9AGAR|nr:hypothetical protein CYLTODRAFT_445853 [Cylindrobasidium torrendii FP15055 ss-10]